MFGKNDKRGVTPVSTGRIIRDDLCGADGINGIHRCKAHEPALQRGEQLEQRGEMSSKMICRLSENGLGRVNGAADGRKRFAAPDMPLIGRPKSADERTCVDQIPNGRILHGSTGR